MVTAEPIVYVIRSGESHVKHGDPYDFSATMTVHENSATVVGATGIIPDRKSVRDLLKQLEIKELHWERISSSEVSNIKALV